MTFFARHISISINASPEKVYGYASDPSNLPEWASGLSTSVRKEGEDWLADSPMGTVGIRFAEKNPFGVLDHTVTLPDGVQVHNPMRVMPNGKGSEVIFSLFCLEGMSDEQFEKDAGWVRRDLEKLREILEK